MLPSLPSTLRPLEKKKFDGKRSRRSMAHLRLVAAENQLGDRRTPLPKTRLTLYPRTTSAENIKPRHTYKCKGSLNWVCRHSVQAV